MAEDDEGLNPLHIAARAGDEEAIERLLAGGNIKIDAKEEGRRKRTALLFAAENAHEASVRCLLEAGANKDATCSAGRTALHYVARVHRDEALLNHFLSQQSCGTSDDIEMLRQKPAIKYASRKPGAREAVAKLLVAAGVDFDANDIDIDDEYTALHCAAAGGRTGVAAVLINAGADVNALSMDCESPLTLAVGSRSVDIVTMLLDAGADTHNRGEQPMGATHIAASNGLIDVFDRLIAAGAAKEAISYNGYTALHCACIAGDRKMVEHLLAAGVAIDPRENFGATPLMATVSDCVVAGNKFGIVAALLDAGANANAADIYGRTPLYFAAVNHEVPMTNRILGAGGELPESIAADADADDELLPQAANVLACAGYRNWDRMFPTPCFALKYALLGVWQHNPKDLSKIVAKMEASVQKTLQTVLLLLHRKLPGLVENLRMEILQESLSSSDVFEAPNFLSARVNPSSKCTSY